MSDIFSLDCKLSIVSDWNEFGNVDTPIILLPQHSPLIAQYVVALWSLLELIYIDSHGVWPDCIIHTFNFSRRHHIYIAIRDSNIECDRHCYIWIGHVVVDRDLIRPRVKHTTRVYVNGHRRLVPLIKARVEVVTPRTPHQVLVVTRFVLVDYPWTAISSLLLYVDRWACLINDVDKVFDNWWLKRNPVAVDSKLNRGDSLISWVSWESLIMSN